MTARARLMGLRVRVTPATAPALSVRAIHDRGVELVASLGGEHRARRH